MNVSIDTRQVGAGLIAGLLISPSIQSVVGQVFGQPNWPAALTVAGLGLAAASVAGNGCKIAPKRSKELSYNTDPALTPVDFFNRIADPNHSMAEIKPRLFRVFSGQVTAPVDADLYNSLHAAIRLAEHGNRHLLKTLELAFGNYSDKSSNATEILKAFALSNDLPKDCSPDQYTHLHGHPRTRLMAALAKSRVASSEFRWLKSVDRGLWYALNNVGRSSYHIEGAGPIAHYFMEIVKRSAISDPMVEKAVDGCLIAVGAVQGGSAWNPNAGSDMSHSIKSDPAEQACDPA